MPFLQLCSTEWVGGLGGTMWFLLCRWGEISVEQDGGGGCGGWMMCGGAGFAGWVGGVCYCAECVVSADGVLAIVESLWYQLVVSGSCDVGVRIRIHLVPYWHAHLIGMVSDEPHLGSLALLPCFSF
ncbi:hypothetical protein U1Q18_039210 [Sarracenia purpurea var. burkii]